MTKVLKNFENADEQGTQNKGDNVDQDFSDDQQVTSQADNKFKSQVEFIRKAQEERAIIEAQRDEAKMQKAIAENRLDAVSIFASAGVANPKDACVLLEQKLDLAEVAPDQLQQAAQELLMEKSYLLAATSPAGSAMPTMTSNARDTGPTQSVQLAAVAQRAARSGNRRDIAEYLRLRRQMSQC